MHRLHRYARLAIGLVAAVAVTAGCAAAGRTHVSTPPPRPLRQYHTLAVAVAATVEAAGEVTGQLEQAILRHLRERQLFARVSVPAATAPRAFDLTLAVRITDLQRVGIGDRLQSGPMAGRGTLTADIALIEAKSQQTIATATATGTTSVDLLFSGTTAQAVHRVAEQVVAFVARYY
jgi:hypothetical protein